MWNQIYDILGLLLTEYRAHLMLGIFLLVVGIGWILFLDDREQGRLKQVSRYYAGYDYARFIMHGEPSGIQLRDGLRNQRTTLLRNVSNISFEMAKSDMYIPPLFDECADLFPDFLEESLAERIRRETKIRAKKTYRELDYLHTNMQHPLETENVAVCNELCGWCAEAKTWMKVVHRLGGRIGDLAEREETDMKKR